MKDAIFETHGKNYTVGQSRDVVGYAAGGTTEDYAYDGLNVSCWDKKKYSLKVKNFVYTVV